LHISASAGSTALQIIDAAAQMMLQLKCGITIACLAVQVQVMGTLTLLGRMAVRAS